MITFNSLIEKATLKMQHGMLIHALLGRLELHGLTIIPYFLHKEFYIPASELKANITPKIYPLATGFLETLEIESIFEHPELGATKESYKIHDRILDGCLCFGVKHEGVIIAYTWCDLEHCNDKQLLFTLKKTEAYLFDMYTFKAYRGKNIAPYMRHQLYSHLNKMGRTDFFSITEVFNNPSFRFKQKLGAHPSKLYLNIKIGNIFKRNFLVRSY